MMYTHLRHVSICRTCEHLHRTLSLQAVRGRETRKLPRALGWGCYAIHQKKKMKVNIIIISIVKSYSLSHLR